MSARAFATNVSIILSVMAIGALLESIVPMFAAARAGDRRRRANLALTPNVHKIHHSRERSETNSNYGNVLCLYDRLLGTFTPADRAASVVYGLDGTDPVRGGSFSGLLSMPFVRRSDSTFAAAAVRMPAGETTGVRGRTRPRESAVECVAKLSQRSPSGLPVRPLAGL